MTSSSDEFARPKHYPAHGPDAGVPMSAVNPYPINPPKTIEALAAGQGLAARAVPDYPALLAGLWETEDDAEAFRRDIRAGRLRRSCSGAVGCGGITCHQHD